jgi:uncharacterized membrane protein/predicted DsbA family dithiol-disulfide isomerase
MSIVGLAASVASLIDDLGASATFCAETGCATVRQSAWAHPLGIPMPVLGIAFYLAASALWFVEAPRLRRGVALAGAAWAVLLIALQATVVGAWCKLCLVADPAAIGYALLVWSGAVTLRFTVPRALAALPALAAAVGLLALWSHGGQAAPEPAVAASASPSSPASPAGSFGALAAPAAIPGTATLVEAVDFECPFCRILHDRLSAAIARARHPVRIVRYMVPLSIHPHARTAALAYCCADAQGKGDAMAAALYAAEPDELTPEGCERLALGVGCDPARYRRDRPAAERRVAAEIAQASAAGIRALPTLWIGDQRLVGAGATSEELAALIDRAAVL